MTIHWRPSAEESDVSDEESEWELRQLNRAMIEVSRLPPASFYWFRKFLVEEMDKRGHLK